MFSDEVTSFKILSNASITSGQNVYTRPSSVDFIPFGVTFDVEGYFLGKIECHLLIDNQKLDLAEVNFLVPLFVEAMNILIGRQLSLEADHFSRRFKLSPPKLIRNIKRNRELSYKIYHLNLDDVIYEIGINFDIKVIN